MALPRYAQTILNMRQSVAAKQNAGPGTITNAYQNYMKSPLLSSLPHQGTTGLYQTGQAPRDFYTPKGQALTPEQLTALRAQAAQPLQGNAPVSIMPAPTGQPVQQSPGRTAASWDAMQGARPAQQGPIAAPLQQSPLTPGAVQSFGTGTQPITPSAAQMFTQNRFYK